MVVGPVGNYIMIKTNNNIIAIIPARAGSKSIKDKNIADLNGYPLLAYSILAAKRSEAIGSVIVSTDSAEYAAIARSFGAEVPFLRPKEHALDESTDQGFFDHAIEWYESHGKQLPEYWLHLRPTTPLRDPGVLDDAISQFAASPQSSSLRSVHLAPESPFKWFKKKSDGFLQSLASNTVSISDANKPKEEFEDVYIPNGYVDIVRTKCIKDGVSIHGENIMGFVTEVVTEVDSPEELNYLRYQAVTSKKNIATSLVNGCDTGSTI